MNLGIVVPGYGSQYIGMGKDLYDNSRLAQEYFEEASNCLNLNFVKLCFASSEHELSKLENAYPTIFLLSACGLGLVKELGVTPTLVAGYGMVGFYTALYAAGTLNFVDTLYLLKKLALFYTDILHGKYSNLTIKPLSYRLFSIKCKDLIDQNLLYITSREPNNKLIVTGTLEILEEVRERLSEYDLSLHITQAEGGFYSPLAVEVAQQFGIYREKVDFKEPLTPIVRNDNGQALTNSETLKRLSKDLLIKECRWDKVINTVTDSCSHLIIPSGSHAITTMLTELYPNIPVYTVESMSSINNIKRFLSQ
ncbi:MAG TPA: acyltransferase domain-containing protein [Candidatus Babeliaceae bacterium]|nr:acyltransferase domain-containing protein [Candidatus Babeliaceae bacterium]